MGIDSHRSKVPKQMAVDSSMLSGQCGMAGDIDSMGQTSLKICGCYMVTFLDWTPIFDWCVVLVRIKEQTP